MNTIYLVEICQHNAETGFWNYKQTKVFENLEDAKKEFHSILGTFICYGNLDHVAAIIWDCYGNKITSEYWHKAEPAPEPEPEVEQVTE